MNIVFSYLISYQTPQIQEQLPQPSASTVQYLERIKKPLPESVRKLPERILNMRHNSESLATCTRAKVLSLFALAAPVLISGSLAWCDYSRLGAATILTGSSIALFTLERLTKALEASDRCRDMQKLDPSTPFSAVKRILQRPALLDWLYKNRKLAVKEGLDELTSIINTLPTQALSSAELHNAKRELEQLHAVYSDLAK